MKNLWNKLKAAPVALCFFVFLFGFMILDMAWPKRAMSELENRPLSQVPEFSWSSLFANEWTAKYGDYVKDQVAFRDWWIDLRSRGEYFQAKAENNGVLYAPGEEGAMMFTKFYSLGKNEATWRNNAQAVETFAKRHAGKVSFMLAPSASVVYSDKLSAPLADENAYLDKIFALTPSAAAFDLRELYAQHRDEYIFYRTDHHWTTHGAYLAYEEFCRQNGLSPFDTSAHEAVEIEDFYGTSFSKSRLWNATPDTLTYYPLPDVTLDVQLAGEGKNADGSLYNLDALTTRDKYAAFLWGNNGYSTITGKGEGSILVIKDSYANCFIPFLTENYEKIGVVDFRYHRQNVEHLVAEYDRVLILYNFQSFYKDSLIPFLNINAGK